MNQIQSLNFLAKSQTKGGHKFCKLKCSHKVENCEVQMQKLERLNVQVFFANS